MPFDGTKFNVGETRTLDSLTPVEFLTWLRSGFSWRYVGRSRSSSHCPLARCMRETFEVNVSVSGSPEVLWQRSFVKEVDGILHWPWVSARRAERYLNIALRNSMGVELV